MDPNQITQIAPWPVIVLFAAFLGFGVYAVVRNRRLKRERDEARKRLDEAAWGLEAAQDREREAWNRQGREKKP